jgi:hypothetical protein
MRFEKVGVHIAHPILAKFANRSHISAPKGYLFQRYRLLCSLDAIYLLGTHVRMHIEATRAAFNTTACPRAKRAQQLHAS